MFGVWVIDRAFAVPLIFDESPSIREIAIEIVFLTLAVALVVCPVTRVYQAVVVTCAQFTFAVPESCLVSLACVNFVRIFGELAA